MTTIKYIGFNDSTGYSISAKNLVRSLRQAEATVHWTPVVAGTSAYKPYSVPQQTKGYQNVIIHTVPEYYPFWIEFEHGREAQPAIWGHTTWETDQIPRHWPDLLNRMDGIFVPCTWNREVFRDCGVQTRIEVLPHISQFHGQSPEASPSPKLQKLIERIGKRFIFYNIGVWSDRKAPWLLMNAFLSEFRPNESVVLVMKTGKQNYSNYRRKWYKPWQLTPGRAATAFQAIMNSRTTGPEIIHLDEEISDSDIAWLHEKGDCFISLTRGEGWGMGAYEAAWWGKPIITTGFGGVLDYLPDHLSYHVKYALIPVNSEEGGQSYTMDQRWANPDLAHARQLMRRVFEDPKGAVEKGFQLREYVLQHFNSALIAQQCLNSLKTES